MEWFAVERVQIEWMPVPHFCSVRLQRSNAIQSVYRFFARIPFITPLYLFIRFLLQFCLNFSFLLPLKRLVTRGSLKCHWCSSRPGDCCAGWVDGCWRPCPFRRSYRPCVPYWPATQPSLCVPFVRNEAILSGQFRPWFDRKFYKNKIEKSQDSEWELDFDHLRRRSIKIKYLICEHNATAFFCTKKDALFALEGRQFRIDFFYVIHQNQFRFGTRRFIV